MSDEFEVPDYLFLDFIQHVNASGDSEEDSVGSFIRLVDKCRPKLMSLVTNWFTWKDSDFRKEQIIVIQMKIDSFRPSGNRLLDGMLDYHRHEIDVLMSGDEVREGNFEKARKEYLNYAEVVIPWLSKHDSFRKAYDVFSERAVRGLKSNYFGIEHSKEIFGENWLLYFFIHPTLQAMREAFCLKISKSFSDSTAQTYIPKPKVTKAARKLIKLLEEAGVHEFNIEPLRRALLVEYEDQKPGDAFWRRLCDSRMMNAFVVDAIGYSLSSTFDFSHTTRGRPYSDVAAHLLHLCGLEMTPRNLERKLGQYDQKK